MGKSEARTGHLGKPFTTPQPNVLGGSIGSKPCRREYSCKALHVRHCGLQVFLGLVVIYDGHGVNKVYFFYFINVKVTTGAATTSEKHVRGYYDIKTLG